MIERIKNDEYLKNCFRIREAIDGKTFVFAMFVRFIIFTFIGLVINNSVISMAAYFYLSFNLIYWRIHSWTDSFAGKVAAVIVAAFWMFALFNLNNVAGNIQLYSLNFKDAYGPILDYAPFLAEAKLAVTAMIITQLVFLGVMIASAVFLAFYKRNTGADVFPEAGTYLSRKAYTRGMMYVFFVCIGLVLAYTAIVVISILTASYSNHPAGRWFPAVVSVVIAFVVLIMTLSRIKDMGFSRLWYLLLVPISIMGIPAMPGAPYLIQFALSYLDDGWLIAFNIYLWRFIYLLSEPAFAISLLVSMAFYFYPEKKVFDRLAVSDSDSLKNQEF